MHPTPSHPPAHHFAPQQMPPWWTAGRWSSAGALPSSQHLPNTRPLTHTRQRHGGQLGGGAAPVHAHVLGAAARGARAPGRLWRRRRAQACRGKHALLLGGRWGLVGACGCLPGCRCHGRVKAAALCSAHAPTACLARLLLPSPQPAAGGCPPVAPRVLLVCGADVLHSMADPALWRQDLLEVCWLRRHSGSGRASRALPAAALLRSRPARLPSRLPPPAGAAVAARRGLRDARGRRGRAPAGRAGQPAQPLPRARGGGGGAGAQRDLLLSGGPTSSGPHPCVLSSLCSAGDRPLARGPAGLCARAANPVPHPAPHAVLPRPRARPPDLRPTSARAPPLRQVRHELERGHSVRYLLPDPVARYIYDHGL